MATGAHDWDVFISHASEDKDAFVRPLADALTNLGLRVWFDEFCLTIGDSLSRGIDKGLASSRFGVVVLSSSFIRKRWPEYELRGLLARNEGGENLILPIWHGVSHDQVVAFSPPLADLIAVNSSTVGAADIALQILRKVRPDIYESKSRESHLAKVLGPELRELQSELERVREELRMKTEELADYRCRHCGAPVVEMLGVPVDPNGDHTAALDSFACGFQTIDGVVQRPCPTDPAFPKLSDYRLEFSEERASGGTIWYCRAVPLTDMARRLPLLSGIGDSKEEAAEAIQNRYAWYANRW